MHLFEAIIDANHRAVSGDASAGLHPAEFADNLPIIALTCIDPRLNALFPNVLGIPGDQFIWMRNAGNIVTGPLSSTMRSLALACAVKGGQEIAIIGHTDCQICKTTTMQLLDLLKATGRTSSRPATSSGTARSSARKSPCTACSWTSRRANWNGW
jgi:carbonic anhydrase